MTSKIKVINRTERKKANLFMLFLLISQLLEILFAFLVVKLTISLYGEPINGVVRFIGQIFGYLLIMTSSLSAVFSIKGIQYYKTNNMAQLL
jgi:hypothetical protein